MARALLALPLLLLPALAAAPADGQGSGGLFGAGITVPTQQNVTVGSLNVTLYVMKDTRSISYTPEALQNPLLALWNYNFTPGAAGFVYVRAFVPGNRSFDFTARLSGPGDKVTVENATVTKQVNASSPPCAEGGQERCVDNLFQFSVANAAPIGPLPLTLHLESLTNDTGQPEPEAARDLTLPLHILDPVPPFAVRKDIGNTTVFGWVSGPEALPFGGGGCLGGALTKRSENVSAGLTGVACLQAIHRGDAPVVLHATIAGPAWFQVAAAAWDSSPFNKTTGGALAPVHAFPFLIGADAPLGAATVTVNFTLVQPGPSGNATLAEDQLVLPMAVTKPTIVLRPPPGLVNWVAHVPVLAATVGGLGYMAYTQRKPRLEPRSQALREMKGGKRAGPPSEQDTEQAEAQRQEAHEAAWDKKRKILEAKREDILRSVRLAEERMQRGEITDHVLQGIKERKERQLEQVEREMGELR
jgi:hypothetical protein